VELEKDGWEYSWIYALMSGCWCP